MNEGVSIIHGARVPFARRSPSRRWTLLLASYLISSGFKPVHIFEWSGGFLRSHLPKLHRAYAHSLEEIWNTSTTADFHLHIIAKSQGAFIAEGALRNLEAEAKPVEVDTLLRIAAADPRPAVDIPKARRVVDLASKADKLFTKGLLLNKIVPLWRADPAKNQRMHIHFAEYFSHHDFNYDQPIEIDGKLELSVYQLYRDILRGARY